VGHNVDMKSLMLWCFVVSFLISCGMAKFTPVIHLSAFTGTRVRMQVEGNTTILRTSEDEMLACVGIRERKMLIPDCGVRKTECECCMPMITQFWCFPREACAYYQPVSTDSPCVVFTSNAQEIHVTLDTVRIQKQYAYMDEMALMFPRDPLFQTCKKQEKRFGTCSDTRTIQMEIFHGTLSV
jgi:hypothetical protein